MNNFIYGLQWGLGFFCAFGLLLAIAGLLGLLIVLLGKD